MGITKYCDRCKKEIKSFNDIHFFAHKELCKICYRKVEIMFKIFMGY